jgi:hypothetical protein
VAARSKAQFIQRRRGSDVGQRHGAEVTRAKHTEESKTRATLPRRTACITSSSDDGDALALVQLANIKKTEDFGCTLCG